MRSRARVSLIFCLLAGARLCDAWQELSLEYRVKAAFLLNFTRFVQWPPAALPTDKTPLSICIFGEDPFGPVLDEVVGEQLANARKLVVQRMHQLPAPGSCQVAFFDRADKNVRGVISALGPGVLTVGEGESFIREGGIVAFVLENRRVRFDISQTAASRAELTLSAKLLNVARSVER